MMFTRPIFTLRQQEVFEDLDTSPLGLSGDEVIQRHSLCGKNKLSVEVDTPLWKHFLAQVTHPFALLLWIAGGMAFLNREWILGFGIWVLVIVNAWLAFQREHRAEQAMQALQTLIPHFARVVRDHQEVQVPAEDLVPGDVLVLAEGDHIPADARVIEAYGLRTSNAALLGESLPAPKSADASFAEEISEIERPNLVFAGTSVVSGTGRAVVYATGMTTQFGRIARLTQSVKDVPTPLQTDLNRFTRRVMMIAIALGVIILVIGAIDIGLSFHHAFVLALGIIVAAVPEGLSANVTLSLAMAGQRLSKVGVLVKKLSIIDSLASLSVICTDKSGTLTQNQMTVREIWVAGKLLHLTGTGFSPVGEILPAREAATVRNELHLLLTAATLCNNARVTAPTPTSPAWSSLGDQTEAALKIAALKGDVLESRLAPLFPRIHELPFDARRKRMTTIHRAAATPKDAQMNMMINGIPVQGEIAFTKGSPRDILTHCRTIYLNGTVKPLNPALRKQIEQAQDLYARQTLRVLALGYRLLPARQGLYTTETVEEELTFLGLVAMHDPPRPEVTEAVKICKQAGIRLVMITGDYGLTAEALAHRVGILDGPAEKIITGAELELLHDSDLQSLLEQDIIYARMAPEHKMRLVHAFQQKGEVVAVTGDGVNDAPALRKADIGIAMGIAGTDVAREAADIILTDDNFAHLVFAIEEGRAIYDNIRKFITYIFSSNVPEVLPFLVTAMFNLPLALSVKQILAIDLVTDMLPGLALGTEKPEPNTLSRPPRSRGCPLIDRGLIQRSFFWLGLLETALAYSGYFLVYALADGRLAEIVSGIPVLQATDFRMSGSEADVQPLAMTVFFAGVVMAQIGNIFACRTEIHRGRTLGWFSNRSLFAAAGGAFLLLLALIYLPPLAHVFQHRPIPPVIWSWLVTYPFIIYGGDWLRKQVLRERFYNNTSKNCIDPSQRRHAVEEVR
ncbi:MAG: cation-transporting P-type ATPase [Anaerolineales bacterium]|nr:cation-transporting P-type ATPase [Anaerolineales bacterium]